MQPDFDEQDAEREGEAVARAFGFDGFPVCPFTIARRRGIEVMPKPPSSAGVSGFLMKVGDHFGICFATNINNKGFERFTVAHELGHYFLPGHWQQLFPDGDGFHASRSGFVSSDPYERQADAFASALLMPTELFDRARRDAGEGFAAIERLSGLCQTSITSTALRYVRATELPVAVIMSSGQFVDWCFVSPSLRRAPLPQWLEKGSQVPPRSTTCRFNKVRSNVAAARQEAGYCSLDDWFPGARQVEMKEDVVGLGGYGHTLTVLFTSDPVA